MMSFRVFVIYNPVCGDSSAEPLFNNHVIPRLHEAGVIPEKIVRTHGPGHAGEEVLNFLEIHEEDITVVLGSGDGTLHEIVDHLSSATVKGVRKNNLSFAVNFVLVPCGTANALYSSLFRPTPAQDKDAYKLLSLEAFLRDESSSPPRSLTLAFTSFSGAHHDQGAPRPVVSMVVTSTALHAAILQDSEQLRKEMPGMERFKVAAHQNITRWYSGRVNLFPMPSLGGVQIYDPGRGDFIPPGNCGEGNVAYGLHGPFAYFVSTVNVDRLEPDFRINPMISMKPPGDSSMDVIVVRPQRDPTFTTDTPQARERFARTLHAVLNTAYQDGNHINLRYSENGDITESGDGMTVVECFRCGGWEWIPNEIDERAHLLCADGAIFTIEQKGRAVCKTESPTYNTRFCVYV